MDIDEEMDESAAAHATAAATAAAVPALPDPMYPPPSTLQPTEMSPQHLYHMIEGQCQQLRQLACSDPARLSSMVWLGLNNLKKQVEQHIDHEQRQQQRMAISGAAAVMGNLTSEGVPLSSLLAPVAVSASKVGRPSSKRAFAAVEGRAASKLQLLLPADALDGAGAREDGLLRAEGKGGRQPRLKTARQSQEVSFRLAACDAASLIGSASAAASASACVSASVSSAASASASASAASSSARTAPSVRSSGRVLVPRVPFEG